MNPNKKPEMPDQTWSVNKEEKAKIVDLGRKLTNFIFNYAKENMDAPGRFHPKIVAGAFQYFQEIQQQKARAVSDDLLIVQSMVAEYDLGKFIDEPFVDVEIPMETKEAKLARLQAEIDELNKPEVEAVETTPATEEVAVEAETVSEEKVDEVPTAAEEEKSDADVEDASISPTQSASN